MKKRPPQAKSIPKALPSAKADHLPTTGPSSWKTTFRKLFSIDPRSLALFRIAMGVLLLADLAVRATDLNAMYTDDGMFSRAEICRRATSIWNWSFHFASGSFGYQAMLFGLAAVLALMLLVGFQTRLAVIGSWLMLISLHHRVPPILSGAEILHRTLLFWAMFLPLERAWSVDRWLEKRRGHFVTNSDTGPVFSVASVAILLQMALMYLFSAIFKSNSIWFNGEAIAGILGHDFYASPAGAYLLQFPALLTCMTWGTFIMEWTAPLFLFFPKGTARLRLILIAGLAAMHIAIGLCLEVGLFSQVSMAGLALFLPAEFWNSRRLAHFLPRGTSAEAGIETTKRINASPSPLNGERAGVRGEAVRLASVHQTRSTAPSPLSWIAQAICMLFLIYVLAVNLNGLPGHPLGPLAPETWRPVATTFGLRQRWGMFEAIPSKDGWYVARAKLKDGSEVDLLRHGAPVDWSKPRFPGRLYPNRFWQKLFREMAYYDEQGFQVFRAPVAEFLCRDWNARHSGEKQVADFEFVYCMANKGQATNIVPQEIFREQLVHLDLSDRE